MNKIISLCLSIGITLAGCTMQTGETEQVESQTQAVAHSACPSGFSTQWVRGTNRCESRQAFAINVGREVALSRNAAAGYEDVTMVRDPNGLLAFKNFPYQAGNGILRDTAPGAAQSRTSWASIYMLSAGATADTECPAMTQGTWGDGNHAAMGYVGFHPVSFEPLLSDVPVIVDRVYCAVDSDTARIYRIVPYQETASEMRARLYYQGTTGRTTKTISTSNAITTCIGCGNLAIQATDSSARNQLAGRYLHPHLGIARKNVRTFYRDALANFGGGTYLEGRDEYAAGLEGFIMSADPNTVDSVAVSIYRIAKQDNVVFLGSGFETRIEPWINEGMAIAFANRLPGVATDYSNRKLQPWIGSYTDIWLGRAPVPTDPKALGSAFWEGITLGTLCPGTEDCIYPTWRTLRDQTAGRGTRTLNANDLRNALRAATGPAGWDAIERVFVTLNL